MDFLLNVLKPNENVTTSLSVGASIRIMQRYGNAVYIFYVSVILIKRIIEIKISNN